MANTDNIKQRMLRREPKVEGLPPRVDMDELANNIRATPSTLPPTPTLPPSVADFAPPAHRDRLGQVESFAKRAIQAFGDLPTSGIDRVMQQAAGEYERLMDKARTLRGDFVSDMQELEAEFERYIGGVRLTNEMFDKLGEQCLALDKPRREPAPTIEETQNEEPPRE